MVGKVIPFPTLEQQPAELTEELIKEKIVTGEAEYLGRFERNGDVCDFYRITQGDQVTIVFDVRH